MASVHSYKCHDEAEQEHHLGWGWRHQTKEILAAAADWVRAKEAGRMKAAPPDEPPAEPLETWEEF